MYSHSYKNNGTSNSRDRHVTTHFTHQPPRLFTVYIPHKVHVLFSVILHGHISGLGLLLLWECFAYFDSNVMTARQQL
jgi:hypothetical protein